MFTAKNKKAWNRTCYSFHVFRLSHCPPLKNEQRRSPRRYDEDITVPQITTRSIHRCNVSTMVFEFARFCIVKTKRQINALICQAHPSAFRKCFGGTWYKYMFFMVKIEHDLKNILSKISLFVKKSFQFF